MKLPLPRPWHPPRPGASPRPQGTAAAVVEGTVVPRRGAALRALGPWWAGKKTDVAQNYGSKKLEGYTNTKSYGRVYLLLGFSSSIFLTLEIFWCLIAVPTSAVYKPFGQGQAAPKSPGSSAAAGPAASQRTRPSHSQAPEHVAHKERVS